MIVFNQRRPTRFPPKDKLYREENSSRSQDNRFHGFQLPIRPVSHCRTEVSAEARHNRRASSFSEGNLRSRCGQFRCSRAASFSVILERCSDTQRCFCASGLSPVSTCFISARSQLPPLRYKRSHEALTFRPAGSTRHKRSSSR